MDGRASARERLGTQLSFNVSLGMIRAVDERVLHESKKDPEITRAAWVRRAIRAYLGRTAPVRP